MKYMYMYICILCVQLFHLGTKNVAKQMLKISQGRVRDRGVTWFPELVDKSKYIFVSCTHLHGVLLLGKSVKTHLYWAMKNCESSAGCLRDLINNIPSHYSVSTLGLHECITYV